MKVNNIYSGMNVMEYDYLKAFHRTLIKRRIKGQSIKELQKKVENYNNNFLKKRGMYLFYDDLTIHKIGNNRYYLLLNGNKFTYNVNTDTLRKFEGR